jgi:hypothetical protein
LIPPWGLACLRKGDLPVFGNRLGFLGRKSNTADPLLKGYPPCPTHLPPSQRSLPPATHFTGLPIQFLMPLQSICFSATILSTGQPQSTRPDLLESGEFATIAELAEREGIA